MEYNILTNKSADIKDLATALARAQAEMPAVPMNAVHPFLHHRFADLGSVISTAKAVLGSNGLAVSQLPVSQDGRVGVTTILMHQSGQWLESTVTLPVGDEKGKSTAQVAGSIITYLRRYSLSAILGMYADEDTDAEAPKSMKKAKVEEPGSTEKPQPPKSEQQVSTWPTRPWDAETTKRALDKKVAAYKGKTVKPSEAQLDRLRSSLGSLKLSDPDRHTVTLYLFGHESTGDLSAAQCSALIDWVGDKEPDYVPNQDSKIEALAVIREYQKEKGQKEMAL